jgi:hypothetical protein
MALQYHGLKVVVAGQTSPIKTTPNKRAARRYPTNLSRELEATAASLGIKAGKGWQARLEHEHERLPGPQTQDCDAMRKWWDWLPPDIQLRARLLEQLHWLIARIDDGLWENYPEDFDEFDRDLADLRIIVQHIEAPSAFSGGRHCGTPALGALRRKQPQRPEPKRP